MVTASLTKSLKGAIKLTRASGFFPDNPHYATVIRWATKGVRGVKLRSWMVGGSRVTTEAAIEDFLLALNSVDEPTVDPSEAARRSREAGAALRTLCNAK